MRNTFNIRAQIVDATDDLLGDLELDLDDRCVHQCRDNMLPHFRIYRSIEDIVESIDRGVTRYLNANYI